MPYFDELVERVKILATSKNSQQYYTTKRLVRDLLSKTLCPCRRRNLRGMRDRVCEAEQNFRIGAENLSSNCFFSLDFSTKLGSIFASHSDSSSSSFWALFVLYEGQLDIGLINDH